MKNNKNLIKYGGVGLLFMAAIVAILLYNKSKMNVSALPKNQDVYYVSVTQVEKSPINSKFSLVGTIAANNDVNIISETSGKVTDIYFNTGDYVAKGSILAQVDDELRLAAFQNAKAQYEKLKKDYDRMLTLKQSNSITEAQYESAKLGLTNAETNLTVATRQYNDTKIKSPISGYITTKGIDVGYLLQSGPQASFIANVVDISRLKVKVNIPEVQAFSLKQGDKVEVSSEVFPGIVFIGKVSSVSVKGDDAHTYPVEILLENNQKQKLRAGMFCTVSFVTLNRDEIVSIPRTALIGSIKNPQVFIVENGKAKLVSLITGLEYGTTIEVVSGVVPGDKVVVDGQSLLKDNAPVRIVE